MCSSRWNFGNVFTHPNRKKLLSGLCYVQFLLSSHFIRCLYFLDWQRVFYSLNLLILITQSLCLWRTFLPAGILGLGLAGFMAVFISTVNSTIMVASATFTKDFYAANSKKPVIPDEMLKIARLGTFICGVAGVGFAFLLPDNVALSVNSLLMLLILLPSVVFGFFWKCATSTAATASISAGFIFTMGFSVFIDAETAFAPGFLISLIVFVVVSRLTKHAESENIELVLLKH